MMHDMLYVGCEIVVLKVLGEGEGEGEGSAVYKFIGYGYNGR